MGVVCGRHRSGAGPVGEAGFGRTRGSRGADCADIVLPDYEFRSVGGLADVSADLYGTGDVVCGRAAVLPERPDFDGAGGRAGIRAACAGAAVNDASADGWRLGVTSCKGRRLE